MLMAQSVCQWSPGGILKHISFFKTKQRSVKHPITFSEVQILIKSNIFKKISQICKMIEIFPTL